MYLEYIINNIVSQVVINFFGSRLVRAGLPNIRLSHLKIKSVRPRPEVVVIPCAKLPERDNSSAPKLAPSSSFRPVRIQYVRPIDCVGHTATIDGLGLARDQEYGLVEPMKMEEARAGKETRRCIPYGRHGRIDLSKEKGGCMDELIWKIGGLLLPSSSTPTSQYIFCSLFQCKSRDHEDGFTSVRQTYHQCSPKLPFRSLQRKFRRLPHLHMRQFLS